MTVLQKLADAVRGPLGLGKRRHKFHYEKLDDRFRSAKRLPEPWKDVVTIADLRPTDRVLDVGCAEGLIALEVAKHVAHVQGIEIEADRVEEARRIAAERKAANVSFAAGSVVDCPLDPQGYDVVLFLEVLGKPTPTGQVGFPELERLLRVTRRQIVVRVGLQKNLMAGLGQSISLLDIMTKLDESGFDAVCFARREALNGNLIIGNRRGTDARLKKAPPMLLVPTVYQQHHPCLQGVQIGAERDFS